MVFRISTPKIELSITVGDINKLRIHEEIIQKLFENLMGEIKSDKVVKHPIIVEENSLTVLDGMHRFAALEKIGCRFVPICLVDYQNPDVKLDCWGRFVQGADIDEVLEVCRANNLFAESVSVAEARELLAKREIVAALLAKSKCYSLRGEVGGIRDIYHQIKELENSLRERRLIVDYGTERDILLKVNSGDGVALLIPVARKEEVLEAAISGNVFPFKTTRHIVPARPMMINIPLGWLTSTEKTVAEIDQAIEMLLRKRKIRHLPPGSQFEGRRYEEELYVFK